MSLLPYSPLAGGVLTGKYNDGVPDGARFSEYLTTGGSTSTGHGDAFCERSDNLPRRSVLAEIAKELDLDVTTLATAWSKQHDFVAATIVGVRAAKQMEPILKAAGLQLDEKNAYLDRRSEQ